METPDIIYLTDKTSPEHEGMFQTVWERKRIHKDDVKYFRGDRCAGGKLLVEILKDIKITLRHARIFITSKERMHEAGVGLYDDTLQQITEFIEKESNDTTNRIRTATTGSERAKA